MSAQQQQKSPIKRYAELRIMAERLHAQRKPIPAALIREGQEIEAWAQANFPPATVQQMLGMVQQEKSRMLIAEGQQVSAEQQRMAQQAQALRQHNADTLARRIGKNAGLDVKNAEEFHRVTKGLPLKRGTPKPGKVDPKLIEQATVNATAHLTRDGKGLTPAQWKDKLEYLWEYVGTGQFNEAAKKIGLRPGSDLKDAMVRYQEQEIIDKLTGDVDDPVRNVTPDDRDVTRAQIAKAMALHLAKEGSDKELDEFHRPELHKYAKEIVADRYGYEGDSVRKDVAETMLKLWPEDEAPEVEYEYDDTPDPSEDEDV